MSPEINGEQMANSVERDRAIRLFTFLKELSELRTRIVRTLDQYEEVIWLDEIPKASECYCIAWIENSLPQTDIWVEINKPTLFSPPEIPVILQPWLSRTSIRNSSGELPSLAQSIFIEEECEPDENGAVHRITIERELKDCPEVTEAWDAYMQNEWMPWAEKDKVLQTVQRIYTRLYSIYQTQQRLGEAYEVMMALGYLTWRTKTGQQVKRHLITTQIALSFNAVKGCIVIGPAAEGAKPELEQDMLEPDERPDINETNLIEELITQMGDAIWSEKHLHNILKAWLHSIPNSKEYSISISPQKEVLVSPLVHFAPAVIMRKRTERSMVRAFKEICENLKNDESAVPKGIINIVKDPDTQRPIIDDIPDESGSNFIKTKEIYFPLPANDKQLEIAHRAESCQGLLVQGPPGTGKSHTIVNLVCHFLASGKRVLVTSHAPRALMVLRDKFPKEISPLCVMALGDDVHSLKGLESSVQGIVARYTTWDWTVNQKDINKYETEIDNFLREEASVLQDLRAIRESETYIHSSIFGSYNGTLQHIASLLKLQEQEYGWFSDRPEESYDPLLSNDEAKALLALLRTFDPEMETELCKPIVLHQDLPTPSQLIELVSIEKKAREQFESTESIRKRTEYSVLLGCSEEKRNKLLCALQILQSTADSFSKNIRPWVKDVSIGILSGQDRLALDLHESTKTHLKAVSGRARTVSEMSIAGLSDRDLQEVKVHAIALLEHLQAGGKLHHFLGIGRPKPVKDSLYLVQEVSLNGRKCCDAQVLIDLLDWLDHTERFNKLDSNWGRYLKPPKGNLNYRRIEYEQYNDLLSKCLVLRPLLSKAREAVSEIIGLSEPIWHDINSITAYIEALDTVSLEEDVQKAQVAIDSINKTLLLIKEKSNYHPIVDDIIQSINNRDTDLYSVHYPRVSILEEKKKRLLYRNDLISKLRDAAPLTLTSILESYNDSAWDECIRSFQSAWNWSRADRWFKRLTDPAEYQRLHLALERIRKTIQDRTADLSSAKAWRHCMSRLSESARQYLQAWQLAVRAIGRGTGIHANRHRRDARMNLERCRSAIPAWIMPIYRVAETVEMKPDVFDVVIVDESSQSGPEAFFLQYLAKVIIVVGDDKQIKPQFVGVDSNAVLLLRQRLIGDLPHADRLGIEHSFFDQAKIRYGSPICLQEHFRCMPEIIQFSNNLCYHDTPLIPLKQYGAGRLTPTVAAIQVRDGYQKGHSPRITNPTEAEAIVDHIVRSCAEEAYKAKTFGIISLLGEDQAKLIQSQLMQRLGPEEMEKRNIQCGDAYAFQGDERDVIFLSLVSAPGDGHRIGTLVTDDAEKRFNVAASRAKEQMLLFHTATLNDLSPACYRYRLLQYCQNVQLKQDKVPGSGIDVEQLRLLAATAKRGVDRPPHPFDSWFEVDIFLRIHDRGFRVLPQHPVAGYKIDLVVEGMRGRMAVECDGDTWHGPEQYQSDMARQRQLERSGYPFWRVRGSVFYREPEDSLGSLWKTLRLRGIFPGGDSQSDHSDPNGDNNSTAHSNENQKTENGGDETLKSRQEDNTQESNQNNDVKNDVQSEPNRELKSKKFYESYSTYNSGGLDDPRSASTVKIIQGLCEIVAAEGPMLARVAYERYLKSCGISRLGSELRRIMNKAMSQAIRQGKIEAEDEWGRGGVIQQIVRIKGSEKIRIRDRGPRELFDIPPSEIIAVGYSIAGHQYKDKSNEELMRIVLDFYGIGRMGANIRNILDKVFSLNIPHADEYKINR
jgi:very-short-patch-repair endonuclease